MTAVNHVSHRSLNIDPQEWDLRVQLAAAYRIIDHFGWSELIWSHTTVRVPGPEHHFLINLTVCALMKCEHQISSK